MTAPDFVRVSPEHREILLGSVGAYYAFDGIRFDAERVRAAIQVLLDAPALAEAWLIRDGAEFVGHFVLSFGFDLEFGGRQATLTELYLEEPSRGRGLGAAALDFVQARLTGLGIRTLELQAEHDNVSAQRFYERAGFVSETRTPFTKRW
ncbi:MAG TPA: GNAT family N-acetyltransferase [Polyangiaceae bacterium]|nr:GNAT family N-acetyltransferase [Polyangiaceae bacterium]